MSIIMFLASRNENFDDGTGSSAGGPEQAARMILARERSSLSLTLSDIKRAKTGRSSRETRAPAGYLLSLILILIAQTVVSFIIRDSGRSATARWIIITIIRAIKS